MSTVPVRIPLAGRIRSTATLPIIFGHLCQLISIRLVRRNPVQKMMISLYFSILNRLGQTSLGVLSSHVHSAYLLMWNTTDGSGKFTEPTRNFSSVMPRYRSMLDYLLCAASFAIYHDYLSRDCVNRFLPEREIHLLLGKDAHRVLFRRGTGEFSSVVCAPALRINRRMLVAMGRRRRQIERAASLLRPRKPSMYPTRRKILRPMADLSWPGDAEPAPRGKTYASALCGTKSGTCFLHGRAACALTSVPKSPLGYHHHLQVKLIVDPVA